MSKLDDILQEYFTHKPEPDGQAWGMDTMLDYQGGKQAFRALMLELIGPNRDIDILQSDLDQGIDVGYNERGDELRRKVEAL